MWFYLPSVAVENHSFSQYASLGEGLMRKRAELAQALVLTPTSPLWK